MIVRAVGLLVCGLLSACAGMLPGHETTPWDGRWVGHFESSLGLLGCPSRSVLDLQIDAGRMTGGASTGAMVISLSGAVTQSGEVREGLFIRDGTPAAGRATPVKAPGNCSVSGKPRLYCALIFSPF